MIRKPDADRILTQLDELERSSWLGRSQREWVGRLFHVTDAANAARIIRSSELLSREAAEAAGILVVDAADREVIGQSQWAHKYARLYFGPRTPTQYHMEGVVPTDQRRNGANCPVPVFLIFDARELLITAGCSFSSGNVGRFQHAIGESADFFAQLPFRDIYHRGPIPGDRKSVITNARCAEVLFEGRLGLDHLVDVVCRTGPERETLLMYLGRELARDWKNRIRLERRDEGLFERRWFYVLDISLIGVEVHVLMSKAGSGPHQTLSVLQPDRSVVKLRPVHSDLNTPSSIYRLDGPVDRVVVRLEVFDSVSYRGVLQETKVFGQHS